jgi:SAM-dependent methyltransferase
MSLKYLSKRPCPVCDGCEGFALAQLTYALFDDLKMSGHKTLVQCNTCGMLYDDVPFSDDQLQQYYRHNEHYAVSDIGGSGSISEENLARYDRIIDLLAPDANGVILDIGCGQGGFISQCIAHGLKAVGIETSVKSREAAHEAGLQVHQSMKAFVTANPSCKIQAVVFSHVLEHLLRPIDLIRYIAEYANNALVYIEVPDADSYLPPGAVCWQEMYFEHLSHFRKINIRELAQHACIEIQKEGAIPFSESQKDIHCRFIVGRFAAASKLKEQSFFSGYTYDPILQFPCVSVNNIPQGDRPLALWGVSQYAMLLLGECPEILFRIQRLFDVSPAKIGRCIKGIFIEPYSEIDTLTDDFILLIPKSIFLPQMLRLLPCTGFKGLVLQV